MYERFYNLRERPFALSPDPEYLYPSRVHQEALDYLRYGLESQAGFIVITGEIGSGKTTLLQALLRNVDNQTTVGRIVNTMLDPRELLESIMIDFGLDPSGRSKPLMVRELSQYLVDQRLAGRLVLLVIDEAQNLGLGALEELRMLSNLETEKSKLLQVVLVGQPNLRDKLSAPELEQLRQRITVSYHLPPLDAGETFNYINHRLRHAALGTPMVFPRPATDLIHARSGGVPRIINVICDAALVFGYAEERHTFDAPVILEVLDELETTGVLPPASTAHAPARRDVVHAPAAVEAPARTIAAPPMPPPAARSAPLSQPVAVATSGAAAATLDAGAEQVRRELERREALVRQREAELAEQRRVLAEEYRLLRAQRSAPAPAIESASLRFQVAGGAPAAYETGTFWRRLKRFMLGVSPS
ncbi:MAG TPA: XrtA/PEP-CTERM system-associated ATPase [Vicinamibacterales bacterium]|nr:XrtA/PEP-CTERM system-associated ATPase [Vicinamibacterales bacterium]